MPPSRNSWFQSSSDARAMARQATVRYPLRTRDLDFLILAGCSCLLTFLYHPVLDQSQGTPSRSTSDSASNTSRSTSTSARSFGSFNAVEPKRQRFQLEEEEA